LSDEERKEEMKEGTSVLTTAAKCRMLNLQMLNMPKGVKKPRRFNKGDMDAWTMNLLTMLYIIGTVVTA
jgi:hypothetical protein